MHWNSLRNIELKSSGYDTGNASNGPGEAEDSQASGRNLARFSREELIALVQKQQTMLDHHNQALDVF